MQTQNNNSHYHKLKNKWLLRHQSLQQNLWQKHADALNWVNDRTKHLAVNSLTGLLLLTAPHFPLLPSQQLPIVKETFVKDIDKEMFLIADLGSLLPQEIRSLTLSEEENITAVLSRDLGFSVKTEINGKRLNRSYGYIGAEQHLMRYPGDSMVSHFETADDAKRFASSGMAPERGAWGYFADSKQTLTQQDVLREKYYIAVQTFLIPDYNQRVAEYRDFFKFRKMLLLNPGNGRAIVVAIGDAGPAAWTGKHLGGSPEVMSYLERFDGAQKGAVLYFFIDDPKDNVPLGPIEVK